MSSPSHPDKKQIESKKELVEWFEKGCTPADKLLIGIEHEKPPFYLDNNEPVPFKGAQGRKGVQDFIDKMIAEKGWDAGRPDGGLIIDISKNNVNWTFEPGLQMETGGAPLKNVHQSAKETDDILKESIEVTKALGFGMLAQGFHPIHLAKDMPAMPKSRYDAIRSFVRANAFPDALDLLACTSTVQVNMGYQSEENMVKMLRVALALQPIAVALFANSPFSEGKLTGYQSFRSRNLYNNMGGRYGFMLPIAFDSGFGFEMFVDYALNTMPLLGVYKGQNFLDAKGAKFQDFVDGNLDICPGEKATISDWQNHLNTIWPEVRVRRFLEMRGTDNGPAEMIKALPAFWVGILYDKQSLDQAYEMVKDWTSQDRDYLRIMTPQHGLQTPFMGTTVQDISKNCLALAEAGLKRRNILNAKGQNESIYLEPLHEIADSGLNWAQRLEAKFKNEWKGDISKLFIEMNYEAEPSVLSAPKAAPASRIIVLGRGSDPKK